jgi:apolipoprotein N-acyltransferase
LHAIAAAVLLIGVPSFGSLRMAQVDAAAVSRPTLKIGVVQGNFGIVTYAHPETRPLLLPEMQRVTAELEAKGAELAVWGETAYPYSAFGRDTKRDLPTKDMRRIRRGFDIPVAVGLVTRDKSGRNPYPWNSAIVVHPDGMIGDRYDKVYPLMFGEWVPFVDPEWYLETIPGASYINIGDGPRVLRVDEWRFAPLICYEDILPRYARWAASQDVHAFLNFTNDSWFGRSAEQTEHLGLAVFRSIEHRRPLVRSVNAGVSAYVDPAGRIVQRTNVTDADVEGYQGAEGFVATIPMMDPKHRTIFARTGEAFPVGCLVIVLVLGLRRRTAPAGQAAAPQGPASTTDTEA